jgi:protein-tyrosine-phosphatase/DNA-binding transcriptional ArsR family regulator
MRGAVEGLSREFTGVFARETIAEVLQDSLVRLGPSKVRTHRPLLAYRFARQRLADSAAASGAVARAQPVVLFVCTRNAGRSQLAAALLEQAAEGRVIVRSAGSEPAEQLDEQVVDVLAETGVDTAGAFPKPLAPEALEAADVVVTMGCGDACPVLPGRRYVDWELPDPAGAGPEQVRDLRDDIAGRVQVLLHELLNPATDPGERLLDDGVLRLLADPLRARVVELLATEALCTSHLVELTGAKQSNVSNHLKLLREADLTTTEPCGRFTYNLLVPNRLRALAGQLTALADSADAGVPRRACP